MNPPEGAGGKRDGDGPLQVRAFEPADRDFVVDLWADCGLLVPHNDPDRDLTLLCATPSSEIFVGVRGERIVASVCVGHDGHRGWLYYLAVSPKLRGEGLGRAMVRHAERWLEARNVPKVQLMVRNTNQAVRGFYEAIGYTLTPRLVLARWLRESVAAKTPAEPATLTNTITYLEMKSRPTRPSVAAPTGHHLALLKAVSPSVAFYRFLYNSVGGSWLWYERRQLDDQALEVIIQDERVEIYVLYADGEPAGYAELDRRASPEIELAYFGLRPEYIGRGLGTYLLNAAVDIAWRYEPSRLWLHTNTLDHPKALPTYQRAGFVPYDQKTTEFEDPRASGLFDGEPAGPLP